MQEAWKRNMQEVRNWRRSKAAQGMSVSRALADDPASSIPLYLPPSHQQPKRSPQETSLSTLLASGAALGHSTSLLNPFYTPYVYGNRSGISVIDLDQTLPILRRTANMVREVVQADGVILIVGTREAHERVLNKAKARLGDNGFVVGDWLPGTLTNSETL
ncbi:30S ribosomal protein S2 [archaeon]|nr:MAG: 30S ribosomal protein S2 [archaeon]